MSIYCDYLVDVAVGNIGLNFSFPDLPEDDNNSTERVLSVEYSAPDGSANSSDQMDNSLSQHQKGNEGAVYTSHVLHVAAIV